MRRLLSHAGSPDRPGLYVARRCRYFLGTVPMLARNPKRIEDVGTTGPDHGADAIRTGACGGAGRAGEAGAAPAVAAKDAP